MAALTIKVEITAPDLSEAIMKLANAVGARGAVTAPVEYPGQTEAYQRLAELADSLKKKAEPAQLNPVQPVPAAPMPAPAPQPVPAAPMPAPAPQPIQAAAIPPTQVQPAPAPMPAPVQAAPAAEVPIVDFNALCRAGAALVDHGKKAEVLDALRRYGVQSVTQLKPEQFNQYAAELRAMGAQI